MRQIFLFIVLVFGSCQSREKDQVLISGSLHAMMMEGKTEATINLADLESENLYALGAMENLAGEITVINGEAINTQVVNDTFNVSYSFETKAALLVYAHVSDWEQISLTQQLDIETLETLLEDLSTSKTIAQPFPFKIESHKATLDWHIVNGGKGSSHSDHKNSGFSRKDSLDDVQLIGFFSTDHQGVFTHRGRNTHIHFKTSDNLNAGHIDGLSIPSNSILYIPKSFKL